MSQTVDRSYLRFEQYRDASNLHTRIMLHKRFSINRDGWYRWLLSRLQIPQQANILEIGCGSGKFWSEMQEQVPWSWDILLTDFSPGMVSEARSALHDARFRFAVADAHELPFADDSFDTVIANHMLYHVPDRERAFAEIRRVLKPGGRLYAATNGQGHLREIDQLLTRVGIPNSLGDEIAFTLENGAAQLEPWFGPIQIVRYEDGLLVTELEPLIAYLLSGMVQRRLVDEKLERIIAELNQELAENGAIRISKDVGLFIARREA